MWILEHKDPRWMKEEMEDLRYWIYEWKKVLEYKFGWQLWFFFGMQCFYEQFGKPHGFLFFFLLDGPLWPFEFLFFLYGSLWPFVFFFFLLDHILIYFTMLFGWNILILECMWIFRITNFIFGIQITFKRNGVHVWIGMMWMYSWWAYGGRGLEGS